MNKQLLGVGLLAAILVLSPVVAKANRDFQDINDQSQAQQQTPDRDKTYQRFNEKAVFENVAYNNGTSFCVMKRETPDGKQLPFAQYRVVGINELSVDQFGNCDRGITIHKPMEKMDDQTAWEYFHGRNDYKRPMHKEIANNLEYYFSPGSVICKNYNLYKVDHEGHMKGTGRACAQDTEWMPSYDPR